MDDHNNQSGTIEFSIARKGYDRSEVDACLRSVAEAQRRLEDQLAECRDRLQQAESRLQPSAAAEPSPETIGRTLVRAQQTAEGVVAEAEDAAAKLISEAQATARATAKECDDYVSRLRAEAHVDSQKIVTDAAEEAKAAALEERDTLAGEVAQLAELRDTLQGDVKVLEDHLSEQRSALLDSASELRELAERPDAFRPHEAPATSGAELPPKLITRHELEPVEIAEASGPGGPAVPCEGAGELEPPVGLGLGEQHATSVAADADDAETATSQQPGPGLFPLEQRHDEAPPSEKEEEKEPQAGGAALAAAPEPAGEPAVAARAVPSGGPLVPSDAVGAWGQAIAHDAADVPGPDAKGVSVFQEAEADALESRLPAPDPLSPRAQPLPPVVLTAPEVEGGVIADSGFNLESTAPFPVIEVPDDAQAVDPQEPAGAAAAGDDLPHAADSFLDQLREAVSSPGGEPVEDPLAAFFDQDDDSRERSWFGRRR